MKDTASLLSGRSLTAAAARLIGSGGNVENFGVSAVLAVPNSIKAEQVSQALSALVDTHEMLRTRYDLSEDPSFAVLPSRSVDIYTDLRPVDVSGLGRLQIEALIQQESAASCARLDPCEGRIVAGVLLVESGRSHSLLLTIHHLAVDGVSWRIIAEDLSAAFLQLAAGKDVVLPKELITCSSWVSEMRRIAPEYTSKIDYWVNAAKWHDTALRTPSSEPALVSGMIGGPVADEIVERLPFALGASPDDILLCAFGIAMYSATGQPNTVLVQGNGRHVHIVQHADLSRTVGWIADDYPVRFGPFPKSVPNAIEVALRSLPVSPEEYTLLRSYCDAGSQFSELGFPQYYFNFHGDSRTADDLGVKDVGSLQEWQIGNIDIFDLTLQAWLSSIDGTLVVCYSFYSPRGSFSEDLLRSVASRWKAVLHNLV
ncbi:condensation domain-containing protein [Nocardia salmonicida]|uniref:condensation domain-containing protein n=1 Tax=Nocardia salmonicida TaxID=53431 RepID=UPI003794CFE0